MASCKVRVDRFKESKSGYAAVMSGSGVQAILKDHAQSTKRAADEALSRDGYGTAQAHKVGVAHGKLARGFYVRANTNHAKRRTLRDNTLKKALS